MNGTRQSVIGVLVFVGLWAVVEALAGRLLVEYSPYQIVWTRYAVHLLFMLVVWGWREPLALVRTERLGFQLSRSMLMLVMPASWTIGMQAGLDGRTLMSVFWLSPLLVMAIAWMFLKERVSPALWLAGSAAFVGTLLLMGWGGFASLQLLIFPIAMALSFSAYVVMTRSLRTDTSLANLFYTALGVFLVLTPFMPSVWITPTFHDMIVLAGIGILGFFTLFGLDRMAAAAPVSKTAPLLALQPVFYIIIELLRGNSHTRLQIGIGILVVLAAVFVAMWRTPTVAPRGAG